MDINDIIVFVGGVGTGAGLIGVVAGVMILLRGSDALGWPSRLPPERQMNDAIDRLGDAVDKHSRAAHQKLGEAERCEETGEEWPARMMRHAAMVHFNTWSELSDILKDMVIPKR